MSCPDCAKGGLHEGTPEGREEILHGFHTYVTGPPAGTNIKGEIVYLPDALGWKFNNSRILADKYAKRTSSKVYLPDFMDGHAMDVSMFTNMDTLTSSQSILWKVGPLLNTIAGFVPFMYYNRLAVTTPRVTQFLASLRTAQLNPLPIGAAGFCWGGKFVFLLCGESLNSNGRPLIDFGFTAHPSNLVLPLDAENVKLPISVAIGDVDVMIPKKQAEDMKATLEAKGEHEMVIIPGAVHGFATRAKPGDEEGTKQGLQAEDQAVNWFNKCFSGYEKAYT
ncbi:hypothetical protein WAI453_003785 [Rhynchosporium graminicola]